MLDSKKPSKNSFTQVEDALFYSNDTDAHLVFLPHEQEAFEFNEATVALYNTDDESLVERPAVIETFEGRKSVVLKMTEDILAHWGRWQAQVVFKQGDKINTSVVVKFDTLRYMLDQRPPTLRDIIKVDELYSQLVTLMDEIAGKDVISAPEIIDARSGHDTLGERLRGLVTIDIASWGITPSGVNNASIINDKIANLPTNTFHEILINEVYDIYEAIAINDKFIHFRGSGGLRAQSSGMIMLSVNNCFNFSLFDITLDGNGLAWRGVDMGTSPYFKMDKLKVKNIGSANINNTSGILLSFGNNYGEITKTDVSDVLGTSVSTGIHIGNSRDVTKYSHDILIEQCKFTDIAPSSDADGVKILQQGFDSKIIVRNNKFVRCQKRGLKVQTKGVVSENNYYEDSQYSHIDFQTHGGTSVNDTIFNNAETTTNLGIAISGEFAKIINPTITLPSHTYAYGIDINALSQSDIANFVQIEGAFIKGSIVPIRLRTNTVVEKLQIKDSTFDGFSRPYPVTISAGTGVKNVYLENNTVIRGGTAYYGFLNLTDSTIRSKLEYYYIIQNDIGPYPFGLNFERKQGIVRNNQSVDFEEDNGQRWYNSDVNPSNVSGGKGSVFYNAKKGDISRNINMVELGSVGSKYMVTEWICIEDGNGVDYKGKWVGRTVLTGN